MAISRIAHKLGEQLNLFIKYFMECFAPMLAFPGDSWTPGCCGPAQAELAAHQQFYRDEWDVFTGVCTSLRVWELPVSFLLRCHSRIWIKLWKGQVPLRDFLVLLMQRVSFEGAYFLETVYYLILMQGYKTKGNLEKFPLKSMMWHPLKPDPKVRHHALCATYYA